jgi:hypothetical protein
LAFETQIAHVLASGFMETTLKTSREVLQK